MIKQIKKERMKFDFYNMLDGLKLEIHQIGDEEQIIYRCPIDGCYAISDYRSFEINYTEFHHYEHIFTKNEIIDMIDEKYNKYNKKLIISHG